MLGRYVLADLVRNPRRTLSTMVGVTLGVGLFCGVLFFVDGLSASMTQRAVAPLAIDMQLVVTQPAGASLTMTQTTEPSGRLQTGAETSVTLVVTNTGEVDAHNVTVRSVPAHGLTFVARSGGVDGTPIVGIDDNPFAHGQARVGYDLGTLAPGSSRRVTYRLTATREVAADDTTVVSTYSSRENPIPVAANEPGAADLRELAADPAVAKRLGAAGQIVSGSTPAEFASAIEEQRLNIAAISRLIGASPK